MDSPPAQIRPPPAPHALSILLQRVRHHFWFKCLGTSAYTLVFFVGYIYLLKHPQGPVTEIPITALDRLVGFTPWSLPIYLSLWVYVSLPPALMLTRAEIIDYGWRMGSLCVLGLALFFVWPSAVPAAHIDWALYPGVAFLKGVDAAGNACPSLHVATAVFSACWLHWMSPAAGLGVGFRRVNWLWCAAIAYSTMATKQHVAIDVVLGALLGGTMAWITRPQWARLHGRRPVRNDPTGT